MKKQYLLLAALLITGCSASAISGVELVSRYIDAVEINLNVDKTYFTITETIGTTKFVNQILYENDKTTYVGTRYEADLLVSTTFYAEEKLNVNLEVSELDEVNFHNSWYEFNRPSLIRYENIINESTLSGDQVMSISDTIPPKLEGKRISAQGTILVNSVSYRFDIVLNGDELRSVILTNPTSLEVEYEYALNPDFPNFDYTLFPEE